MPIYKHNDVELYYEEHGTGFPVLLIAPGGMRSAVSFWQGTPWNPIAQLAPNATLIEKWKEPEPQPAAKKAVEAFLAEHTPR